MNSGDKLTFDQVKKGKKYVCVEDDQTFVPEGMSRVQDGIFVGVLTEGDGTVRPHHEEAAMAFLRGKWRAA